MVLSTISLIILAWFVASVPLALFAGFILSRLSCEENIQQAAFEEAYNAELSRKIIQMPSYQNAS